MADNVNGIERFYAGKCVLITGGTGFLGKFTVYKLLKSCEDIDKIYLLMRSKGDKSIEERIDTYFNEQIFEYIDVTKCRHKIRAVEGDITLPNYGLSDAHIEELNTNVNVVFHMAATVNFTEPLPNAIKINVQGTKTMLELCRNFRQLEAMVHVSTTYTQVVREVSAERVYDSSQNWKQVLKEDFGSCTDIQDIINPWPNSYTFTKAISETMIQDLGQNLPVCIFRPAVVVSTYKEPFPGWVDNKYGPMGLLAYCMVGLLQILPLKPDANGNLVPVDYVVNSLLAAGWDTANTYKNPSKKLKIPVFNFSSTRNCPTQGEIMTRCGEICAEYPSVKTIRPARLIVSDNSLHINFMTFWYHHVPAICMDLLMILTFRKPKMAKLYRRVDKMLDIFRGIIARGYTFQDDNVVSLWHKLSERDKQTFQFNVSTIDWDEFFVGFVHGIRIHILKDDMSTLEEAKFIRKRQRITHFVGKILLFMAFRKIFIYVLCLLKPMISLQFLKRYLVDTLKLLFGFR